VEEKPEAAAAPIVLSNVSVLSSDAYGNSAYRLKDANLQLGPGEWLYLVGVNGSGKSTLARLLAGLHTEGVSGSLARGFAGDEASPIVLQQPEAQLFGETPREEVNFALEWRGVAAERIADLGERALHAAGLSGLADSPWERLSGGQKQLAAIAAAAACDDPLIVLDEVTSMLDEANRMQIEHLVNKIQLKGVSVVWVTQRLDELQPDRRVVALDGGQIVYDGETRFFMYGGEEGRSPCELCGLRLPYMAQMAISLRALGRLQNPLPMTRGEWRKVLGRVDEADCGIK